MLLPSGPTTWGFFKRNRLPKSLILVTLLLSACNESEEKPPPEPQTVSYTYLALGDSYTIGTALPDSSEAYPIQLVEKLNEEPDLEGDPPKIIAFGGWRTDQLLNGIDTAAVEPPYDLVSLLIGVNNQFQNQSPDLYADEFEELLNKAISMAGNDTIRVFVLSIPDYGVTPFGAGDPTISAEIDTFNAINLNISESYGITYFNITEISRKAENDPGLLAPDNLHPSGAMYELWVNAIFDDVKAKLYD
jgi:lysophospholipase L1-like esterase